MKQTVLSTMMIILALVGAALCAEPPLTSLDTSTALSDIRASRGVVFVDLYADW